MEDDFPYVTMLTSNELAQAAADYVMRRMLKRDPSKYSAKFKASMRTVGQDMCMAVAITEVNSNERPSSDDE